MTKRVGLYLRVSTRNGQTVDNQRQALTEAIGRRQGWVIVDEFSDEGISGAKGRDKRPEFDRLLKEVVRGKIDVVAAWSVDRLGRSLQDLISLSILARFHKPDPGFPLSSTTLSISRVMCGRLCLLQAAARLRMSAIRFR